jgi:hypothetical protein
MRGRQAQNPYAPYGLKIYHWVTRPGCLEPLCFWKRIYALPGPMDVNTMLLSRAKCL